MARKSKTRAARSGSMVEQFAALKEQAASLYEFTQTAMQPTKRTARSAPGGADGNYNIRNQRSLLASIAFARALEADNPAVMSAGNRLVNNINVGQMMPRPDTGDEELNQHLVGKWKEYVGDKNWCDSKGLFIYEQQADIAFRRTLFDGDLFPVVDPDNPATVMHLEAHRCQTPSHSKIDRGVCGIAKKGNRTDAFWLTKKNLGYRAMATATDVKEVKAFNSDGWEQAVQIFNPKMFSMDRGFSALGSIGTTEQRRDDLEFATVLRGQVASCITLVEKAIEPELIRWMVEQGVHPKENADVGDEPTSFEEEVDAAGFPYATADLHPGRVLRSRLGYQLEMLSPQITGDGQLELNMLLLQYLAMVLDLPLCALLLDARMGTFSTFRGVMDLARDAFKKHQRWFGGQYHAFRYRTFLRSEIPKDALLRKFLNSEKPKAVPQSRLFKHTWTSPAFRYYHPVDDAMGDIALLSNGMKSIGQYAEERYQMRGVDFARGIIEENTEIMRLVMAAKKQLEKEFPGVQINENLLYPFASMTGIHMTVTRDETQVEPVAATGAKQ